MPKFDKNSFNKYASNSIKKLLSSHIDELDGKEVFFEEGSNFGEIQYEVNGECFILYPVLKEWCTKEEQLMLF